MPSPKLSDLAAELGLNKSTVCRALRRDPQIAAATAERIRRHAEKRGYQRDPSLSALAEARWRRAPARVNWGFLVTEHSQQHAENRVFTDFLRQYAEAAGYSFDLVLMHENTTVREINRMIEARSLRGILVNPIHYRETVASIDFSKLCFDSAAWVFCGEFFFEPPGHRVVENFFGNMMLALGKIATAGHRKIAFIYRKVPLIQEARGPTRYRAAALEFARAHSGLDVRLVPLLPDKSYENPPHDVLDADALLFADMRTLNTFPRQLRERPYVVMDIPYSETRFSGIRRAYQDIALSAVDMLDLECRRYVRGIPPRRHTLVVESEWWDGMTLIPHPAR